MLSGLLPDFPKGARRGLGAPFREGGELGVLPALCWHGAEARLARRQLWGPPCPLARPRGAQGGCPAEACRAMCAGEGTVPMVDKPRWKEVTAR